MTDQGFHARGIISGSWVVLHVNALTYPGLNLHNFQDSTIQLPPMLLLMDCCPLTPPSNGSIHPLQRLLFRRNLEPFLMLLPTVRTRAHITNANIPQLKMNQPLHAMDIRRRNTLPSPGRRIRRRMRIRIIPKQSEIMRALLGPLINPAMHIIRTTDFQPHTRRRLARGTRYQRIILPRGADRIPDTADIRQTCLREQR